MNAALLKSGHYPHLCFEKSNISNSVLQFTARKAKWICSKLLAMKSRKLILAASSLLLAVGIFACLSRSGPDRKAQLPDRHSQLARNRGQRLAAAVDQLHGLLLELKIGRRSFRFRICIRGHGGFSFSGSPPPVRSIGGTSRLGCADTLRAACEPCSIRRAPQKRCQYH